ncbi:MAG: hypothetical protein J5379_04435 [Clostridiales bacterium]|nr:hypothetical protein [Clostridiales bacterium]
MSEYTLNSSKSTGALGLTLTLRNFRRYLIIGIIIPLILSIPAMIVQGIWIRHDKEGTFPGMRIEYLDSVPAEVEDRFEKVNGKYEIVTEENWDLKDRVYAFTQTAFYLLNYRDCSDRRCHRSRTLYGCAAFL